MHFQQMKDAPWICNLPSSPANRQPQAALALAIAAVSLPIIIICFVYFVIASGKVWMDLLG
jgi:hypothetical protein